MSASWDGRSKGNRLGYKIFVMVLKMCGLNAAYFLLFFEVFHFFLFVPIPRRAMYNFFCKRIGKSMSAAYAAVYKNYYLFGQTLIDKIATGAGFKTNFAFEFDGEQWLHEAAAAKQGLILLGAHAGNWEMAGHYLQRIDTPVNILMYSNEYRKIQEYLDSVSKKSFTVIEMKDDFSHIYKVLEAVKNGEFVCMHGDRCFDHSATATVPFLNKPARFPKGVFSLCVAAGVPVTFVYAFKERRKKYHFYATEPKLYSRATAKNSDTLLLHDYVNELERRVRQYPLQWFNYYNFWKQ